MLFAFIISGGLLSLSCIFAPVLLEYSRTSILWLPHIFLKISSWRCPCCLNIHPSYAHVCSKNNHALPDVSSTCTGTPFCPGWSLINPSAITILVIPPIFLPVYAPEPGSVTGSLLVKIIVSPLTFLISPKLQLNILINGFGFLFSPPILYCCSWYPATKCIVCSGIQLYPGLVPFGPIVGAHVPSALNSAFIGCPSSHSCIDGCANLTVKYPIVFANNGLNDGSLDAVVWIE